MGQWQQFWPLLLVMALSALSWVIQKLREQKSVKQARDAVERRKLEELRTGRASEPSEARPGADGDRLQDLAARRQAQLRELRLRQAQQQGGAAPPVPQTVVLRAPQQGAPTAPQRVPAPILTTPPPSRAPRPVPQPQRQAPIVRAPAPQAPRPARQTARSEPRVPAAPSAPAPASEPRRSTRAPAEVELPAFVDRQRDQGGIQRLIQMVSSAPTPEMRLGRMMILGEVLGPPVSLRQDRERT